MAKQVLLTSGGSGGGTIKLVEPCDAPTLIAAGKAETAFTGAGKKWNVPKQSKRTEIDSNPTGLKLAFTEKTGVVKGTFMMVDGKANRNLRYRNMGS